MSKLTIALPRITGSSDRRSGASGASTSFILTVQKVFIDHHALASARDTVGATWHRIVERPRPSDSNICTPGVAGSKPTAGAIMG